MGRTAVNDEENTILGAGHQPCKKLDENIGVDATFFLDHEPHMASRGHRRDQTHAVPRSGTHDNRCLSPFAPGPACMMIRAHMRRVAEEYIRSFPSRTSFDFRVLLLEPFLHKPLVAFQRMIQRLLTADPELRQKPS